MWARPSKSSPTICWKKANDGWQKVAIPILPIDELSPLIEKVTLMNIDISREYARKLDEADELAGLS